MEAHLVALLKDPDFARLELAMREPNIFRALAIERKEIRHSNFFAYLLDPGEAHGLDDFVLRRFLRDVFSDERSSDRSFIDADLLSLDKIEVRREWKNIDIFIDLPEDVIVIENKVDSQEHSDQLGRYRKTVEQDFGHKKRHLVFLTPFGGDPVYADDKDVYITYSYAHIANMVEEILHIYRSSIPPKVCHYLEDYVATIRQELLMNDKLNDLAAKLYKAHKIAFDFVLENRPDPASILYPYFESALRERGFEIGSKNKGYVRFLPPKLTDRFPKAGSWWTNKEIFLFEIDFYWSGKAAIMKAVISPGDEDVRTGIIDAVRSKKFFHKPAGQKWLVFYTKKVEFIAAEVAGDDSADIRKKVSKVVDTVLTDVDEITAALDKA